MSKIFFKSRGHGTRFVEIMRRIDKIDEADRLDQYYAALVYVLTSTMDLTRKSSSYIHEAGIAVQSLIVNEDFSSGQFVIIKWAANLFNATMHCDPDELVLLDAENLLLCLSALELRRRKYSVHELYEEEKS